MLCDPDGALSELVAIDLPLGLRNEYGASENATTVLPEGSVLVLYTDGLTESTRDVLEGERRLREALARGDIRGRAPPPRRFAARCSTSRPTTWRS